MSHATRRLTARQPPEVRARIGLDAIEAWFQAALAREMRDGVSLKKRRDACGSGSGR